MARQVIEACGWEWTPKYIVRDRDSVYGGIFTRRLRAMGIRDRLTAPQSPWQNGHTERLIGSIRRNVLITSCRSPNTTISALIWPSVSSTAMTGMIWPDSGYVFCNGCSSLSAEGWTSSRRAARSQRADPARFTGRCKTSKDRSLRRLSLSKIKSEHNAVPEGYH